jgi:hypothetical protein
MMMKIVDYIRQVFGAQTILKRLEVVKKQLHSLGLSNKELRGANHPGNKLDSPEDCDLNSIAYKKGKLNLVSMDKLGVMWYVFAAILLMPLLIMSVNRGILPVDDITYIYGIANGGDVVSASKLIPNFI